MVIVMSSGAINASPSMAGKDMNETKRSIFLKTFFCLSTSDDTCISTGWATLVTMLVTSELPIIIHLFPWV